MLAVFSNFDKHCSKGEYSAYTIDFIDKYKISTIDDKFSIASDLSPFVDENGKISPQYLVKSCNLSINGPSFPDTDVIRLKVTINTTNFDCQHFQNTNCKFGIYSGNLMQDQDTLKRELISFPNSNQRLCNNETWSFTSPSSLISMYIYDCPPIDLKIDVEVQIIEESTDEIVYAIVAIICAIFLVTIIYRVGGRIFEIIKARRNRPRNVTINHHPMTLHPNSGQGNNINNNPATESTNLPAYDDLPKPIEKIGRLSPPPAYREVTQFQ